MSNFEITDYEAPKSANLYAEAVAAHLEAGEGKALTINVEAGQGKKHRLMYQRAANEAGKTARVVEFINGIETGGDDELTFILTEKHAPRKRASVNAEAAIEA